MLVEAACCDSKLADEGEQREAAFDAIASTMPLASVGYEAEVGANGERLIWLAPNVVDRLQALRGPVSNVILRLAGSGEPRYGQNPVAWCAGDRDAVYDRSAQLADIRRGTANLSSRPEANRRPVRKEYARGSSVRPKTGRPGLAFPLMWRPQEGRDERDPQARGDPGCRCRRL